MPMNFEASSKNQRIRKKLKVIVVLFILSLLITAAGAILKLESFEGSSLILLGGLILGFLSLILMLILLAWWL